MKSAARLFRYGLRFATDRKYRNRVLDILNRQAQGADHPELKNAAASPLSDPQLRGKRLFIAAGCDQSFLAESLSAAGMEVCQSHALGRGTDPVTEFLTPGSRGLSEPWDAYLLSVSQVLRGLIRKLQLDGINYPRSQQDADLNSLLDHYRHGIQAIRKHSDAPVFLFTYLLTYLPTYGLNEYRSLTDGTSLIEFWHRYHLELYALTREFEGVYVFDADRALADAGQAQAIDPDQSNGIFDHPTRQGARWLAEHFVRQLAILEPRGRRVKCAVFDLDNTLWAGVLREDGPTGVSVNEYYLNVMEKLAARGILLALCSKNDPVEAEHLPTLLGAELHPRIVAQRLSWNPKSHALREIAAELNIGLDSLAFFDDSPFEREEVAANAPEVLVLPPEALFSCLNRPDFHQPGDITVESLSRTEKYQQQSQRKQAEQSGSENIEEFLHSCEFELEIRRPTTGEISRVHELLQRTNQLNATLTRPSQAQIVEQFQQPGRYLLQIARLKDRFGDYGLIGYVTARDNGSDWQILDLAFSCRSMGRGVERAMLIHVARAAQAEGAHSLSIRFLPGPRNQQMLQILQDCGFSAPGEELVEGRPTLLARSLFDAAPLEMPAWLHVSSTEASEPEFQMA